MKNDCLTIIDEILKIGLNFDFLNHPDFQQKFYEFLFSVINHNFDIVLEGKNWDLISAFLLKGVNDFNFEISILSLENLLKFLQVMKK